MRCQDKELQQLCREDEKEMERSSLTACRNKTLNPAKPRRSTQGLLPGVANPVMVKAGSLSSGTRRELFLHPGSVPWQQVRGWELCASGA